MKPVPCTPVLRDILEALRDKTLTGILVGGCVRDAQWGIPIKDYDIEVYGSVDTDSLQSILKPFGSVKSVGKTFGVLLLEADGLSAEFALPRTEQKIGPGHKGFSVTLDPELSFDTASQRRDFTINSMGYDPLSDQFFDPHNGLADLEQRLLRAVGPQFGEDPLRVLRAIQFCARFQLTIEPETLRLCQTLDLSELPKERLFEEFKKLFLKSEKPSLGLEWARKTDVLRFFPELKAIIDVPQDPKWHPEGDVWTHTLMVVDEMAQLCRSLPDEKRLIYLFAALCHDFGKAVTTRFESGRWRSLGHEKAGVPPTISFMQRLTANRGLIDAIVPFVEHHLKPANLFQADQTHGVSDAAIRRLATKVVIRDLVFFCQSDHFGRGTPDAKSRHFEAGDWLLSRAQTINVVSEKPAPLLMGRHLISLGIQPGKQIGLLLQEAYDLQLEGQLTSVEDAIKWAQSRINQ